MNGETLICCPAGERGANMHANAPVPSARWWRRLGWRCEAESRGFSSAEAARLAFWRWLARDRLRAAQRGAWRRAGVDLWTQQAVPKREP